MTKKHIISMVFLLSVFTVVLAQPTASDTGFAEEEFRRGVQSYYRGSFNDAILQFEKALSFLPDESLILDWLGKSYYRSGMEGVAIQQWELAGKNNYGGLLLDNRIEIVRNRRITDVETETDVRYVESGSFSGKKDETVFFSQPISVLPLPDGNNWVIAYGTNELLQIDINGTIIQRVRGPLVGFDRPMDIIQQKNGNLLITEYAGDRVTQLDSRGGFIQSFGSKGRGMGQLLGPQYLAEDESGNIFVTDYGNGRVMVFNSEGEPLFSFGKFRSPSGIAILQDTVYIADTVDGSIYTYDTAGNYQGMLLQPKSLQKPEALKNWGSYLLVADTNRVLTIDVNNGAIYETAKTGNNPTRLTCATVDRNGNILATDFKNNEIYILSRMPELVGGLFVQIEKVYAENFPSVTVEVRVENRNRKPIVGLKDVNFLLTEEKRPVANQQFLGSANTLQTADITLLIDRSAESANYGDAIETAVKELSASLDDSCTLRIVSVGTIPVTEYVGKPSGVANFSVKQLKNKVSSNCAYDLGIRLAANDLINAEKKRSIIFITCGTVTSNGFSQYGLVDLSAYLNNNAIGFAAVNVSQKALSSEMSYLVNETTGEEYYVFRPEGLSQVVEDLIALPSGIYQLSYTSSLPTNFGRQFLSLEVETYLLNRSGRDESGYYAPME